MTTFAGTDLIILIQMNKFLPKIAPKGFTLVELMIAISIVAILAAVGFTVYSTTQISARDTKRRQDIDAIAAALESKKTPGSNTYTVLAATDFSGGAVPADPKAGAGSTGQRNYCIVQWNDVPPPAITAPTWANFSNKVACVSQNITPAMDLTSVVAVGSPQQALTTAWVVCAFLENGEVATPSNGSVYCKSSN